MKTSLQQIIASIFSGLVSALVFFFFINNQGLVGEKISEVKEVLTDLKAHNVDMVTLGQYLQPSKNHLKVERFVHPTEFEELRSFGEEMGFMHVASGPLVRSSYHADKQAHGEDIS